MNRSRVAAAAAAAAAAVAVGVSSDTATPAVVDRATVQIFVPRGEPGARCTRVFPLPRRVAKPAVLTGALRALVAGPTAAERARGYGSWFSAKTTGMVRSVRVARGVAYVDFRDFSRLISNASSSCGSALLLAQLDRTTLQFPTVERAVYSFVGNRRAFYEWLQRDAPR